MICNVTVVGSILPFNNRGKEGSSPGNGRLLASRKGKGTHFL